MSGQSTPRLSDEQFAYLLVLPLIFFAIAIVIYPVGYSLWIGFHDISFVLKTMKWVGLGNYAQAISDPDVADSIGRTLRFTFETVVLSLLLSLGSALVLNESFKGRGLVRAFILLPWALSEYATATVWRYMYSSEIGFVNGFLYAINAIDKYVVFLTREMAIECIAIAYAWHMAPLGAFFFLATLQTIPEDLYRAAKVDGAGPARRFWRVTFPFLSYPTLIVLVLTTMYSASTLDVVLILTQGGPGVASEVVTYKIYTEFFRHLNLGYAAAISYLLIIIVLAIGATYFTILTRYRRR